MLSIIALFCSCEKRCHCYRFDGAHEFFTREELNDLDKTCIGMESTQMGLIYSLCEWDNIHY